MRCLALPALILALLAAGAPVAAQVPPSGQWQEIGIDRFGADYRALDVTIPAQCRAECARDPLCQAYTVQREPPPGSFARRCWLKSAIPGARRDMRFESGIKGADPGLSIAVINMNNIDDFPADWRTRYERVASEFARLRIAPDVIAITEAVAASSVWWGEATTRDWEVAEVLHAGLRAQLGVPYRFASHTGLRGDIGLWRAAGWTRGWMFQTQMLLYNPQRLLNQTPQDAAANTLFPHDAVVSGIHLRASHPICDDAARRARVEGFLDGPLRPICGSQQPAAPAWNLLIPPGLATPRRVGAFTRLAFPHEPDRFLEIYNIQPPNEPMRVRESAMLIASDLRAFLDHPKGRADAAATRFFPPLIVGDFQVEPGSPGWDELERAVPHGRLDIPRPGALVRAILGARSAYPSVYPAVLRQDSLIVLPEDAQNDCDFGQGVAPGRAFTNHCTIIFRLEWDEAQLQAADQAAMAALVRPIRPRWPLR